MPQLLTTAIAKTFAGLFLLSLLVSSAAAQHRSTDSLTPVGLSPSAPAGASSLAGFDDINLFNGNLKLALPLLEVNGRGEARHTLVLPIKKRWTVNHSLVDPFNQIYAHNAEDAWWSDFSSAGLTPGNLIGRQTNDGGCREPGAQVTGTMTRLTFIGPDGSELNFYDTRNNGGSLRGFCTGGGFGASRGTVFVSTDGPTVTFVSDAEIRDEVALSPWKIYPSGHLLFRDGTRYRIHKGKVMWVRDRNGNLITFTYDQPEQPFGRLIKITDSLGREVSTSGTQIAYKGSGGADRTIRVEYADLNNALRPGYTLKTMTELFGLDNGNFTYNPQVVSAVVLSDGVRRYRFYYNSHGELARVELPTGGAFEYDWGASLAGGTPSGVVTVQTTANGATHGWPEIYRRVLARRVISANNTVERITTYGQTQGQGTSTCVVTVDHKKPDGALVSREKHYFYGNPVPSVGADPMGWEPWDKGREYQTEFFDEDGQTLLRRAVHTWAVVHNIPSVTETVTTLADTNQVTKQAFSYDQYNNRTDVYEYDFGAGAPGPLIRRRHTDYVPDPAYTSHTGAHLRSLPRAQQTYGVINGSESLVSQSETLYDQYGLESYGAVTGWADPGTSARGNPTTTRNWLDTNNTWLETRAEYDHVGNVRRSWDAKSNLLQIEYSAAYHHAYPTKNISPAPDPSGANGSTTPLETTTTYDFSTGLVTQTTDAAGRATTYQYNDALNRLTRVGRPDGGWTVYWYDRNQYGDYIGTRTAINASLNTEGYTFFDGLGRPARTFQFQTTAADWITVDTQYDSMGRVWRVSNPYLSGGSGAPVNPSDRWTTTAYDALSRVKTVTTPDGAVVNTSYSGNTVTVTDQAGKQRRSVSDALGQLAQVVEAPGAGSCQTDGAGCSTDYLYDALGNLRKVTQGQQTRYFMYDSLGRLIRAKNPEQAAGSVASNITDPVTGHNQWSMAYGYDQNGNLEVRVDARNITTTYQFDNVNRVKRVTHSDGTPETVRYYDLLEPASRGHLWRTGRDGNFTDLQERDAAGRPRRIRQWFGAANGWRYYDTTYRYDLAGNVVGQTYPSGHTTTYQYDAANRHAHFSGTLGDGVARTYSDSVSYDEAGRMQQERFGTAIPLYHKRHYNVRGQLFDVRLSTLAWQPDGTNQWDWNRGCLALYYGGAPHQQSSPSNNGNVTMSQHWVPGDDQYATYRYTQQTYGYDALNRLTSVTEESGSQAGAHGAHGAQHYTYDRWGNRLINASATWGAGINSRQFTVDPATNRLGVPAGQPGVMTYDSAGNLNADTYSAGAATRSYDADGRMTRETNAAGQVTGSYGYDGDGRRVRRSAAGQEWWYLYGLSGELLAEYGAQFNGYAPQREYGYRGGELLVDASAYGAQGLQADFYNSLDFTSGSLTRTDQTVNFEWHGASPGPGVGADNFTARWTGYVTPRFSETYTFYTQTDDGVRLWVDGQLIIDKWIDQGWTQWSGQITLQAGRKYSIRMEFYERGGGAIAKLLWSSPSQWYEVIPASQLTPPQGAPVKWMVTDHLGSPRMIADQTGSLAGVTRRDYLPFGEEVSGGVGGRTRGQGYSQLDGVRQGFTGKERDGETGLDYFQARYYAPIQGRFTSVDPDNHQAMRDLSDPQSWNAYAYVNNNPLRRVDPDGKSLWEKLKNLISGNGWRTDAEVEQYYKALEDKWRNWLRDREREAGGTLVYCPGGCAPGAESYKVDIDKLSREEVFSYAASLKEAIESSNLEYFSREQIDQMGGVQTPIVGGASQPDLKYLHKPETLSQSKINDLRKKSTEEIIESMKPGSKEALRVKPDGTVMNGHHRLEVLKERGVDINKLPREIYTGSP